MSTTKQSTSWSSCAIRRNDRPTGYWKNFFRYRFDGQNKKDIVVYPGTLRHKRLQPSFSFPSGSVYRVDYTLNPNPTWSRSLQYSISQPESHGHYCSYTIAIISINPPTRLYGTCTQNTNINIVLFH